MVTNCTTRKRAFADPLVLSESKRAESLATLAARWGTLLRKAPRPASAGELYVGRSIVEAKQVTRFLEGDLFVVSAGLGVVHESEPVPNYDLSVNGQDGPLKRALASSNQSPAGWWSLLTAQCETGRTLAGLLRGRRSHLLLVALPSSYLRLVADDLAAVRTDASQRLRIFTSVAGQSEVPARLRQCILPYDDRLESITGYDGTRAEFPQRALRHFVFALCGHTLPLDTARSRVEKSLEGLNLRSVPERERRSDDEITALIRAQWTKYGGSSGRLHRYLRDEALVACEQSRFRTLWHGVLAEKDKSKTERHVSQG